MARPVRLGQREGESVAVKGGLTEGDRVVVGGRAGLGAGRAVKARPATSGQKEER